MTAARSSAEDKSLKPGEDKTSTGAAPVLDRPADPKELRASDAATVEANDGRVRVMFVHHHGDKKPGGHATIDVAEANTLIAARVAVLAEK